MTDVRTLSRRSLLLGAGMAGFTSALAGCGARAGTAADGSGPLTFWYWSGALSDDVVRRVAASVPGRRRFAPTLIEGDFKARLTTTLTVGRHVPDVTGIKGEDMPEFLALADHFLDLNHLGATKIADSFAPVKYAAARTSDGKQVGLPIDLGPTGLFFRKDLWAKGGLPSDPAAVSPLMSSWDGWFEAAARLKTSLPGTFAVRNSTDVFGVALAQQSETFVTRTGQFAGDGGGARVAWDLAVRSITEGVQAGIYDDPGFKEALTSGTLTSMIGPAWIGLDIESGAPSTSGAWRVADCPGGPGNVGGSFLTLPAPCRDPQAAFDFVSRLLTPANEAQGFADASIFPAVTAAYALPALRRGQKFYGGQATIDVFGPAAKKLPSVYDDPRNNAVSGQYYTELSNVEGGKDPEQAWDDAVSAGRAAAAKD